MYYLYLAIAIGAELMGTTFIKSTECFTRLVPSIITIVSYGVSFYFFARCLDHISLSFAYALWSGLGIIVSTLVSVIIYKEGITPLAIVGIVLILIGVVILNVAGSGE